MAKSDIVMLEVSTVEPLHEKPSPELLHRLAWGRQWPLRRICITRSQVLGASNEAQSFQNDYSPFTPEITDDGASEWYFDCLVNIAQVARACNISEPISGDLVILDSYPRLYDGIESGHRYMITGHPGIGKTPFLLYVLLRRLEQRLPTAIQFMDTFFYLFTSEGVQKLSATQPFVAPAGCWALSDCNQSNDQPCSVFATAIDSASHQRITLIYATSHWGSQKRKIEKHLGLHTYVVPLPKVTEIIAIVSQVSTVESSHVTRLVASWGPCIRTILAIVGNSGGLQAGERWARDQAAAAALAVCNNSALLYTSLDPIGDPISPLIFIAPEPASRDAPSDISWRSAAFIPTDTLCAIFAVRLRATANDNALEVFRIFKTRGPTWTSAGPTRNEKRMHGFLLGHPQRGPLQIDGPDGAVSHVRVADTLAAGGLPSLNRVTGTPSTYWIPFLRNFAGIDAVLIDDQCIYAFQATNASQHRSPADGLVRLWTSVNPDVRSSLRWLFVVCKDPYDPDTLQTDRFRAELATLTLGDGIPIEVWSAVLTY